MIHQRRTSDRHSAHLAVTEAYGQMKREPGLYLVRWQRMDPDWRTELRGALHGTLLRQIAERVWVPQPDGLAIRYTAKAWKEFFKELFLPEGITSTEDLMDDEYAELLLQVSAFACLDLNLELTEPEAR